MQIATPFIRPYQGAGEYAAKPNLPGDESVSLFFGFTILWILTVVLNAAIL